MNRVPLARRIQIINCLVEGNSIHGTERMTGTHRDTLGHGHLAPAPVDALLRPQETRRWSEQASNPGPPSGKQS